MTPDSGVDEPGSSEGVGEEDQWWMDVNDVRFWKTLLVLGVLLHVFTSFTSNLGLDTHVTLAAETVEEGTGEAVLDWGHTRPKDPLSSDPAYARPIGTEGIVELVDFGGVAALRFYSLLLTLAGAGLIVLGARGIKNGSLDGDEWRYSALFLLYPVLIFATGRLNGEAHLAFGFALMLYLWVYIEQTFRDTPEGEIPFEDRHNSFTRFMLHMFAGLFIGLAVVGVAAAKGMVDGAYVMLYPWLLAPFVGLWMELTHHPRYAESLVCRPQRALLLGLGLSLLAALYLGFTMEEGKTLAVMREAPARYLSAVLISVFDLLLVFGLFGMILWPFAKDAWRALDEVRDWMAGMFAGIIGAGVGFLTLYVAALWTHESLLWGAPWPGVTWTMGNNGRYISLLIIPLFWLLMRLRHLSESSLPTIEAPGPRAHALFIGIMLILPISLLTGIHGQTMWTDEAAEVLSENMDDGEDFLFVSEATQGMHWLYTFHYEVDPYGERSITGHWRADVTSWEDELVNGTRYADRGDLSNVHWVVLSPDVPWSPPAGWGPVATDSAPWMNGGCDWIIWSDVEDVETLDAFSRQVCQ